MTFSSRLGGLIRQSVSQSIASNVPAPMSPFMLNAVRMMSTVFSVKLHVEGLSSETNDQSLREAFIGFGDLEEARVVTITKQTTKKRMVTETDTGISKGYAFVTFSNQEAALSALAAMDGEVLNGQNIRVKIAKERIVPRIVADPTMADLKRRKGSKSK